MSRGRHLLAALAFLLALVAAAPPAGAGSVPGQTDDAGEPGIELVSRPRWVRPEDRVSFTIRTTGDVSGTSVRVEVFSALDSVAELEESASEDVGVRLSLTPGVPLGFLPRGPQDAYEVGLQVSPEPVDDFTTQLVEPGVHPVVISLVDESGTVLDEIRTPMVRLGDEDDPWDAPRLGVVLDAGTPPTLQPDGTRSLPAAALERLGRVARLLAEHPDLDLTVAAVPDTVDALAASPEPGAAAVLDALRGREALAMPYLPMPVESLVDAGLGQLVPPYTERGATVLADLVEARLRTDTWEATAAIGDRGGRLLQELGYRRALVPSPEPDPDDDGEDDADEPPPLADSGPRVVEGIGPLQGVVVDTRLSAELAAPLAGDADAAHLALARLLLRPVEGDPSADEDDVDDVDDADASTTVVVRPGPLPAGSTLAGLLDLLDDAEAPVQVGGLDLVDDTPVEVDADPIDWDAAERPDLRELAPRVREATGHIDTFATMIGDRSARADELRLQIATGVAATASPSTRDAAITTVEQALGLSFAGIRLSGQTDLNLTSRTGTLPVTIENGNPFPVDLVVRIRSDRLAFPDGGRVPVTVDEDILRIDVPVEALATGSVPVFVELWTPDEQLRLAARQLNVRSTAVSGVGLFISLSALVVLVVWWARTWRSTRRGRAGGPEATSVTAGEPMG
ncbi:MAG TPA: DUF6049 family protein [Acidimicrobiales bacterium]|nr:DUF6049 family protein [Acidimicrobiales bacterium]